jgi:inner membrane protein
MMKFPLLGKAVALGGVIILLLIGLHSVSGLVYERQMRQHEAEQSVAESLAGSQTVLGPVMKMRCDESWDYVVGEGKQRTLATDHKERVISAWPRALSVNASAAIEPRYRGLFKLNGYLAKNELSAQWDPLPVPQASNEHAGARVSCEAPIISVAVSDARGIRSAQVRVNGSSLPARSGSRLSSLPNGFHAVLPTAANEAPVKLELGLELAGTRSLAWTPIAQDTQVRLASSWPHPSFGGRFLPVERQVSTQGFQAQWRVSGLATTAQQAADGGGAVCEWRDEGAGAVDGKAGCVDAFGVGFIDPVNGYVLNDRALKYGLLFIALTFVAVGLIEVLRSLRVHPIQYLLVGCALTVFFLLLLSLSEHLAFGIAYLAASAACTALLAFYGAHVLGGARPGLAFGAGIALLYGVLYALLQMEQAALVLGSLLLFGVLAAVMIATRRIDWYALATQLRNEAGVRSAPQA